MQLNDNTFGEPGKRTVKSEDKLRIDTGTPGWRPANLLKLVFVLAWCILWYQQWGGIGTGRLNSVIMLLGLIAGLWMLLLVLDHVYSAFRLEITPDSVTLEMRTPFRQREWTCSLPDLRLGEIDVVIDRDETSPGIGAHRFLTLHLGAERVQFVEGHPEEDLARIRRKIMDWLSKSSGAA